MKKCYDNWIKPKYADLLIETYSDRTVEILSAVLPFYKSHLVKATSFRISPNRCDQIDKADEKCILDELSVEVHQLDEDGNEVGEVITTLRDACYKDEKKNLSLSESIHQLAKIWDYAFTGDFTKVQDAQNKYALSFISLSRDRFDSDDEATVKCLKDIFNYLSMAIVVLQMKLDKKAASLKFIVRSDIMKCEQKPLQKTVLHSSIKETMIPLAELIAFKEFIKFLVKKNKKNSTAVKKYMEDFGAEYYDAFTGVPECDPFKVNASSIILADYHTSLEKALKDNDPRLTSLVYL